MTVTGSWTAGWQVYTSDLDGNGLTDLFGYHPDTGVYDRCLASPAGGFTCTQGRWAVGWMLTARNGDAIDPEAVPLPVAAGTEVDAPLRLRSASAPALLLYDPASGVQVDVTVGLARGGAFGYDVVQGEPGWTIVPARLDTDGLSDALLYDAQTGAYQLAYGTGTGFRRVAGPFTWAPGWRIMARDFSSDGLDDFLLYNPRNGVWVLAVTIAGGDFRYAFDYPANVWPLDAVLLPAHVNDDGVIDLVLYEPVSGRYSRQRTRTTAAAFGFDPVDEGTWPPNCRVAPIQVGDGPLTDFVVYDPSASLITWLVAGGRGFNTRSEPALQDATLLTGDFNGDRRTDVLLYARSGAWLQWLMPARAGEPIVSQEGTWLPAWSVVVGDLNADGLADLFGYHEATGAYDRCLATPTGTFACSAGNWNAGWRILARHGDALDPAVLRVEPAAPAAGAGAPLQLASTNAPGLILYDAIGGLQVDATVDESGAGGFRYRVESPGPGWAIIPARLNRDGLTDALLYNPDTGAFQLAFATSGGYRRVDGGAWASGWRIQVVDFNRDGLDDFLLHEPFFGVWVQVLVTETGDLAYFTEYPDVKWPDGWRALLSDFDGDSLPDVVLYDTYTGSYRRHRAKAPGGVGFTMIDEGMWAPHLELVPAFLDGDARGDLLAYDDYSGYYTQLVAPPGTGPYGSYRGGWWGRIHVLAAEFNGDGRTDFFAYAPESGAWMIALTPAGGLGEFVVQSGRFDRRLEVSVTDFNRDSLTDVFAYDPRTGAHTRCLTTPSQALSCTVGTWATGWSVISTLGDSNLDHLGDALLLRSLVPVSFEQPLYFSAPMIPSVADLNGDGALEMLGAVNDGTGRLQEVDLEAAGLGEYERTMALGINRDTRIADLTGDGLPDLVTNLYTSVDDTRSRIRLYVNRGDGTFAIEPTVEALDARGFGETIVTADFDNDGDLDIFIPHYSHNSALEQSYLLRNDGAAGFVDVADAAGVALRNQPELLKVEGTQAVDFDGDGWLDLFAASHFFFNNGDLTFTDRREALGLPAMFEEGVKFVDWNNDGTLDLVLHEPVLGPMLYEFDGSRFTYRNVMPPYLYGIAYAMNAYDLNNDGFEDIITAGGDYYDTKVLLNARSRFVRNVPSTIDRWGNDALAFGDFDRDGRIDIAKRDGVLCYTLNTTTSTNTWLEFEVVDADGRRNQQGRVVYVVPEEDPSFIMTRVVDGGSGMLSQNQYAMLVGTPFTGPHTVTVRFAGGDRTFVVRPRERKRLYADGSSEDLP